LSYEAYIASDRWKSLREKQLEIDGYRCKTCGEDGSEYRLEVHHIYGGPPDFGYPMPLGEEKPGKDLITLCRYCHEAITNGARDRRAGKKLPELIESERVTPRKGIDHVSKAELSIDIGKSDIVAQWAECRPAKPLGESAQSRFEQALKDGR
jgi:hypothetical protein